MARPLKASPERILAAAAGEFASRGYAGARVDRIARQARVNKAMLYYHFGSKQGIYRALLRSTFLDLATRLDAIAATSGSSPDKLDAAVRGMAGFVETHPFFPAIMLREVADGGTHLDAEALEALASVPRAFAAIIGPGIQAGAFRRMHPLAAYFTTVAPILMYVASRPVRKQLSSRRLIIEAQAPLTPDVFVGDLQQSLRLAFAAPPPARKTSR